MAVEAEKIDLQALIQECGTELDVLIKSEQDRIAALAKNEPPKEEPKKEEPMVEAVKKDEGSGFESPTPEASSPSPSPSPSEPSPSPEAAPTDDGESLQSMIQSLDDQMLDELIQAAMMEKDTRSQAQQGTQPSPEASPSPTPAPSPSPEASGSPSLEMAYKKEMKEMGDKLAKSQEQASHLEKAFSGMTDLLDKMINRPVQKAVTDIKDVQYVDKGESDLKKAEQANISDEDLKKKALAIANDTKELAKLNKNEREVLSDFFVNKKKTPEVLKLVFK